MIALLLLPVAALAAAPGVDEAEARALAELFYGLTGRLNPAEAFLLDDIAALQESERSADELEQAVRWIAANVDAADRYTLAGLLESYLATALGEEEELILPDPEDRPERDVLAPAKELERWTPSAALVREVIEAYYEGTGRRPPSPPREEDLAGVERLVREGWTEAGLRLLVDWVPDNVKGAEQMGFDQVARVAVERGYNGGPQPNGRLEELRGVRQWEQDEPDPPSRDPQRFDGGRVGGMVTMGALPTVSDRALQAARLPGLDIRMIEGIGRVDGPSLDSGAGVLVGQSSAKGGFIAQVEGLTQPPGTRDSDRYGPGGGPTRPEDLDAAPVLSARFSIGGGQKLPAGGTAYAYRGVSGSGAGAQASLNWFGVMLTEAGAGLVLREVDGHEVSGLTLSGELSPSLALGPRVLQLRARAELASGGLADDAFPVESDLWFEHRGWVQLSLRQEEARWAWGAAAALDRYRWALSWDEDDRYTVTHQGAADRGQELELVLGGRWHPLPRLMLHAGLRGVQDSALGLGGELAGGVSWLLREQVWLSLGARGGLQGSAQATVAFPF
ncbi:MAG: hypothetical protein H6740_27700 [Alphaproteobacteria bacterium]|nr:hypothetical protein [Alphaproteobacteria bacterium]